MGMRIHSMRIALMKGIKVFAKKERKKEVNVMTKAVKSPCSIGGEFEIEENNEIKIEFIKVDWSEKAAGVWEKDGAEDDDDDDDDDDNEEEEEEYEAGEVGKEWLWKRSTFIIRVSLCAREREERFDFVSVEKEILFLVLLVLLLVIYCSIIILESKWNVRRKRNMSRKKK